MTDTAKVAMAGDAAEVEALRRQVADLRRELAMRPSVGIDWPAGLAATADGRMLGALLQHVTFGWACLDRDCRYIQVNPLLARWNGQSAAAHVGRTVRQVVGDAAAAMFEPVVAEVFATGRPVDGITFAAPAVDAPTRVRQWTATFYPIPDADGHGVAYVAATICDETARREAEESVRASDERYRNFIARSSEGIYRFDLAEPVDTTLAVDPQLDAIFRHAVLAECNDAMARMYGYDSAEQLVGMRLDEFMDPTDPANDAYLRAFVTGGYVAMDRESRERDRDGVERIFLNNLVGVVRDGRLYAGWGTQRDVTDQRRAETLLRENEERLRLGLEAGQTGTWDWNIASGRITWSEQLYAFHGVTTAQFDGSIEAYAKLVHPDDAPHVQAAIARALADPTFDYRVELRAVRPDGSIRWLATAGKVYRDADGRPVRMMGATTDVTDRMRAEDALRRAYASLHDSDERLRLAQRAGRVGTWEWDVVAQTVVWSEGLYDILGLDPERDPASFDAWQARVHPDDRPVIDRRLAETLTSTSNDYDAEFRICRPDGKVRWLTSNGRIIRDAGGRAVRMMGANIDITDRKTAQQELEESRRLFQRITEATPDILYLFDLQRRANVFANREVSSILGYTPEQIAAMGDGVVDRLIHPDDLPRIRANDVRFETLAEGERVEHEYRMQHADGSWRWLRSRDVVFSRTADGRPHLVLGVAQDVTAAKAAEQALRDSERRLRAFVEANVIGIITGDVYGGISEANDEFLRIVGYDRDDVASGRLRWTDLTPPEDLELDRRAEAEVRATGRCAPYQKRYIRRDGTHVPVLVGYTIVDEAAGRSVAFVLDVSEREQAERLLRDAYASLGQANTRNAHDLARLESVLTSMSEGLVICDQDGNVLSFNPAALRMHGFDSADEVRHQLAFFHELFRGYRLSGEPVDPTDWPIARALRGERFAGFEMRITRADKGIDRVLSYAGTPIRDEAGRITLGMVTIRDVGDEHAAAEELRHAKQQAEAASQAKDHFLAQLSHELRTPLTPVLMTAQALEADPSLPAELKQDVELIRRNVELEARLIDDLLDLTRIARQKIELHREVVDLHGLVEHALTTCLDETVTQKRLHVRMQLDATQRWVWGDSARLQQVLWNLIKNAIKFTGPGGFVTLRSTNPTPDTVRVDVVDSGVGIEADALEAIFNAFEQGGQQVTRRFGGLGLGLAISKALMNLHGGLIRAASDGPATGATFTIELPVVAEMRDEATTGATSGTAQADVGPLRILLVEDHELTARVLRRLLANERWSITHAPDVRSALAIADREPIDLVVSDLGLPDGSGYQLMTQLRKTHPSLRGIAVSGYGMEEDLRRSAAAGFARHLVKPVNFQTLRDAIRDLVAK